MRIAIVFPPTSGRGGIETATVNLVNGLKAIGDDVQIFALSESVTDGTWHSGLPWKQIGNVKKSKLSAKQALLFGSLLGRELRRFRPDVVVTLTAFSIPIVRLAFLFAGRRVPIASWLHFTLNMIGRKRFLRFANGHIAISGTGANELRSYLGAGHPVFAVPNGTCLAVSPVSRPRNSDAIKFVYMGRMQIDDQKRVNDILVASAGLHGNFHISFVGAGDDLERLQQMSMKLGIKSKVSWLGWHSDPWRAVGEGHALLLTSSFEGCPMVLVEAMARGLACISADCETGPSDMITPGRNGWLFPVGDVIALTALMQRIIDDPSALPSSEAVIESVRRFGVEQMAASFKEALVTTLVPRANRYGTAFDSSSMASGNRASSSVQVGNSE
jgi:UDP-D-galactose:(glucosyl)LPS alpha-1,6-D-galactosyltransferase